LETYKSFQRQIPDLMMAKFVEARHGVKQHLTAHTTLSVYMGALWAVRHDENLRALIPITMDRITSQARESIHAMLSQQRKELGLRCRDVLLAF
jgi:hypothetical protein